MMMRAAIRYTSMALLTLSLTSIARAADAGIEVPTKLVKFADLDLHRDAGIAALYGRLRIAARQVCESRNPRDLASIAAADRCMRQALEKAVADVGSANLASYHRQLTGRSIVLAQR